LRQGEGAKYELSITVKPGEGVLEEIPQRLFCNYFECANADEPLPDKQYGRDVAIIDSIVANLLSLNLISLFDPAENTPVLKSCPQDYEYVGVFSEFGNRYRVCEFHPDKPTIQTPEPCGKFDFLPSFRFWEIPDGSIITLSPKPAHVKRNDVEWFSASPFGSQDLNGKQYLTQFLAPCDDCAWE